MPDHEGHDVVTGKLIFGMMDELIWFHCADCNAIYADKEHSEDRRLAIRGAAELYRKWVRT